MADPTMSAAFELNGVRVDAARFYSVACDPQRHVAIEACAGAGKTWVLVSRIVRALLLESERTADGQVFRPDRILAITFTRLAAAEMRERLVEWLERFARTGAAELAGELRQRGMPEAEITSARCEALRSLYQRVLASGQSVQIRTFHGWFASLLRVAPMSVVQQLGLPANHELLEDDEAAIERVWRPFYDALAGDVDARADFEALVLRHGRAQTEKALDTALRRRGEFERADRAGAVADAILPHSQMYPAFAGLPHPALALAASSARARWLGWSARLGQEDLKTPRKAAEGIVNAFAFDVIDAESAQHRLALLRQALFVSDGDRLNLKLAKYSSAQEAAAELEPVCLASAQHDAWLHQQRMARVTRLLIAQYRALKHRHGWVDMADVEDAAETLLGDPVVGGWVQERLDQSVRHLLIDEFQDTNPMQWQALVSWLGSYAGAGSGGPQLFFVGDPKQSIYRFRRAEPAVFRAAQEFVRIGLGGDLLSCDHTRRSSQAVLAAVNTTMGLAAVAAHFAGFRVHTTASDAVGDTWALPPIQRPKQQRGAQGAHDGNGGAWRDSLEQALLEPEDGLRAQEARQAAGFLRTRIAMGLSPGQAMVLSRTRANLAPIRDALRELGIPAQIGEKTSLADCAEVQDLVALVDVLVSPAHDLSLARVLKSPLFGLDDRALVALAARRRVDERPWLHLLWDGCLQESAELLVAARRLQRWRTWVQTLPPHDALQAVYDDGDVLAAYAMAMPRSARAATLGNLRALLSAALAIGGGRFSSPYALVRAFRTPGGVKAPAALQPDAVRLLTIHGAKGLEADLVLLLDTDKVERSAQTMTVLVDWPAGDTHPRRCMFLEKESNPPACARLALEHEQAQRQREENNALYVAMTRARHELAVSSIEPHQTTSDSWWNLLRPLLAPAPPADVAAVSAGGVQPADGPFALLSLPQVQDQVANDASLGADAAAGSSDNSDRDASAASRLGQAMHRLLQWDDLSDRAMATVASEFALDAEQATAACAMARQIRTGAGAMFFDVNQLGWAGNEVELQHAGRLMRLDRLVRTRADGVWWVLDYKAAAEPQRDPALIEQLLGYQAAVSLANPGQTVRAAFLTGRGEVIEPAAPRIVNGGQALDA